MRVLHFLDTLGRGGAEMQALDVARNAADHGIDLTVAAGGGGGLESAFRDSGVEVVRLQRRLPVDPFLALMIRQIIKERQIDIEHGYQPVDGIHLWLAASGLANVRKVLSFQGFIQDRKNRATAKFVIPRMDANIVVSRGLQKWLSEKDNLETSKKFSLIYNGADPKRLVSGGNSLRAELGIDAGTPLVGMIANFYRDRRKDQLSVAKAMAAVVKKIPNAHCVFVGGVETGAEDKLAACVELCSSNMISENVRFLGSRNDIPDILAELDISILSSFHEGLPVAISESMLAGASMIVSDIDPHLEASQNGEYAEVFPTGNAEVLAEKILLLLGDTARRERLSRKAKEFAIENLSIYSHLRDLKKLYEDLQKA
ncbi:MAG: glycosyltransferase family 4 protein [Pyrinomonadaceae bacterium]